MRLLLEIGGEATCVLSSRTPVILPLSSSPESSVKPQEGV